MKIQRRIGVIAGYMFLTLAVVLAAMVGIAATRPPAFHVERTVVIAAPAARAFAEINDFGRWLAWSPYAESDPKATYTYSANRVGPGAWMSWSGNSKIGEGRSTIVESKPNELIKIKLEMVRPFAATNDVEFRLRPEGSGTAVTWAISGQNNLMVRTIGLVVSMDKVIGGEFVRGLDKMKTVVEHT